jgi:hypothetical protein
MPKTLIGWAAVIVIGVVIWKNPSAAGHFVFTTIPAKVSAFFGGL